MLITRFERLTFLLSQYVQSIKLVKKRQKITRSNCKQNFCPFDEPIFTTFNKNHFFLTLAISQIPWIQRSKRTKNHTVDWLFKNIRFLGHIFHFDIDLFENYRIFQDLLDSIDVNNKTQIYNTQEKFEYKVNLWNYLIDLTHFTRKIINRFHRNVRICWLNVDGVSNKRNAWIYLSFVKHVMDIVVYSIMYVNSARYPLKGNSCNFVQLNYIFLIGL